MPLVFVDRDSKLGPLVAEAFPIERRQPPPLLGRRGRGGPIIVTAGVREQVGILGQVRDLRIHVSGH